MFRVWAVARHMIAESIRQKIALVGVLLIAVILLVLPFVAEGDGLTLTSRVQSFLAYSLGAIGVILSVVTIFLSCMAVSDEIANKRIFMIATKPIPRWQFFLGKWVGIGVLNAVLLSACFGALLLATWGLSKSKTNVPGDRDSLQFEVLSSRHSLQPTRPDFTSAIEDRIRTMREEGRLDSVRPGTENALREQMDEELKTSWRSIPPGGARRYEFKGLMVDRDAKGYLYLRFNPKHAGGMSDATFPAVIKCGDVSEEDTLTPELRQNYHVERWYTLPIPKYAVNKQGTLYVMIFNADPESSYTFEGSDSLELLYELGTFHWNLFRALSIVWCRLAFLAVLGLMLSTWLSFPVACMGAFLVFMVGSAAGWLSAAVTWVSPKTGFAGDPLWIMGPFIRPLASAFIWMVPDFSKFDPASNVVNGRLVPLMWIIQSVKSLLIIKGLVIGVVGSLILSKRELAQET